MSVHLQKAETTDSGRGSRINWRRLYLEGFGIGGVSSLKGAFLKGAFSFLIS